MDYLRSGYRTRMRLFKDSDYSIPVIWYRADPSAEVYRASSRFRSWNWQTRPTTPGVGEETGPRPYYDGHTPFLVDGRNPVGTPRQFREGSIQGDPFFPYDAQGLAGPAVKRSLAATGGVVITGAAILNQPPTPFGAGGVALGGVASTGSGVITGQGGAQLGGAAAFNEGIITGQGGLSAGGFAEWDGPPFSFGQGGVEVGGFAEWDGPPFSFGQGGVEVGGSATMT